MNIYSLEQEMADLSGPCSGHRCDHCAVCQGGICCGTDDCHDHKKAEVAA